VSCPTGLRRSDSSEGRGGGLGGPVIRLQEEEEKDAGVSWLKGRKQ